MEDFVKTKTVTIALYDGVPQGARLIEDETEILKALVIPRKDIHRTSKLVDDEASTIYLLMGKDEKENTKVYVGQTRRISLRVNEHNRDKKKEWWDQVVYFIQRSTPGFSAGDLDYLEWLLAKELSKARRVTLDNANKVIKSEPSVSHHKKATFMKYYNQIVALTALAGFDIFNKAYSSDDTAPIFFCKNTKGANAQAVYRDDGFYVLKDSKCCLELVKSAQSRGYIKNLREKLIQGDILKKEKDAYIFTDDYKFNSPSSASSIVLGRPSNGWNDWCDQSGKKLTEIYPNRF